MRLFSIGEALIDFFPYHEKAFLPVTGGAPANVAACAAKLGKTSFFVGKVGQDLFGSKIIKELKEIGVDTTYLKQTNIANTALSFVTLQKNGERDFAFYRKPSADMFLTLDDVSDIRFEQSDILHFCSVDLVDMPVKEATRYAINSVKAAGGTISFDPNVRKALWEDHNDYKKVINDFLPYADIIKIAEDELEFITDSTNIDKTAKKLLESSKIVLITLGEKGSFAYTKDNVFFQSAFSINCVDTTGAGDSFMGAFLSYLDIKSISDTISQALYYANACAGLVCSKKGVLTALPTLDELNEYIKNKQHD